MEELRGWWEVPSIAHFCSLFRDAFGLLDFDIEELEEAFLSSNTPQESPLLFEIICRLLGGCYQRKDITYKNYEKYLRDILKHRWNEEHKQPNPLPVTKFSTSAPDDIQTKPHKTFWELTLRSKVEVLHALCDFRLDADDVVDVLKDFDTDVLRLGPIGYDKTGASYWYFYGTRLYKQDPEVSTESSPEICNRTDARTNRRSGRGGSRGRMASANGRSHQGQHNDSEASMEDAPSARSKCWRGRGADRRSTRSKSKEGLGSDNEKDTENMAPVRRGRSLKRRTLSMSSCSESDEDKRHVFLKRPVLKLQKLVEVRKKSRNDLEAESNLEDDLAIEDEKRTGFDCNSSDEGALSLADIQQQLVDFKRTELINTGHMVRKALKETKMQDSTTFDMSKNMETPTLSFRSDNVTASRESEQQTVKKEPDKSKLDQITVSNAKQPEHNQERKGKKVKDIPKESKSAVHVSSLDKSHVNDKSSATDEVKKPDVKTELSSTSVVAPAGQEQTHLNEKELGPRACEGSDSGGGGTSAICAQQIAGSQIEDNFPMPMETDLHVLSSEANCKSYESCTRVPQGAKEVQPCNLQLETSIQVPGPQNKPTDSSKQSRNANENQLKSDQGCDAKDKQPEMPQNAHDSKVKPIGKDREAAESEPVPCSASADQDSQAKPSETNTTCPGLTGLPQQKDEVQIENAESKVKPPEAQHELNVSRNESPKSKMDIQNSDNTSAETKVNSNAFDNRSLGEIHEPPEFLDSDQQLQGTENEIHDAEITSDMRSQKRHECEDGSAGTQGDAVTEAEIPDGKFVESQEKEEVRCSGDQSSSSNMDMCSPLETEMDSGMSAEKSSKSNKQTLVLSLKPHKTKDEDQVSMCISPSVSEVSLAMTKDLISEENIPPNDPTGDVHKPSDSVVCDLNKSLSGALELSLELKEQEPNCEVQLSESKVRRDLPPVPAEESITLDLTSSKSASISTRNCEDDKEDLKAPIKTHLQEKSSGETTWFKSKRDNMDMNDSLISGPSLEVQASNTKPESRKFDTEASSAISKLNTKVSELIMSVSEKTKTTDSQSFITSKKSEDILKRKSRLESLLRAQQMNYGETSSSDTPNQVAAKTPGEKITQALFDKLPSSKDTGDGNKNQSIPLEEKNLKRLEDKESSSSLVTDTKTDGADSGANMDTDETQTEALDLRISMQVDGLDDDDTKLEAPRSNKDLKQAASRGSKNDKCRVDGTKSSDKESHDGVCSDKVVANKTVKCNGIKDDIKVTEDSRDKKAETSKNSPLHKKAEKEPRKLDPKILATRPPLLSRGNRPKKPVDQSSDESSDSTDDDEEDEDAESGESTEEYEPGEKKTRAVSRRTTTPPSSGGKGNKRRSSRIQAKGVASFVEVALMSDSDDVEAEEYFSRGRNKNTRIRKPQVRGSSRNKSNTNCKSGSDVEEEEENTRPALRKTRAAVQRARGGATAFKPPTTRRASKKSSDDESKEEEDKNDSSKDSESEEEVTPKTRRKIPKRKSVQRRLTKDHSDESDNEAHSSGAEKRTRGSRARGRGMAPRRSRRSSESKLQVATTKNEGGDESETKDDKMDHGVKKQQQTSPQSRSNSSRRGGSRGGGRGGSRGGRGFPTRTRRSSKCGSSNMEDSDSESKRKSDAILKRKQLRDSFRTVSRATTRWQLVCSTIDSWRDLADKFKDSKVRSEKMLHRVLSEDFLPDLPAMVQEAERERVKHKAEMATMVPPRLSPRIEIPKLLGDDETRAVALSLMSEDSQDSLDPEERRQLIKYQIEEEERRAEEERSKAKQDRAKRAELRERRIEAEGKESMDGDGESPTIKTSPSSDKPLVLDEDVTAGLVKVLETVKNHGEAWSFMDPVTDDDAPGYSDIVEEPMCLVMMTEKLEHRIYRTSQQFIDDFMLIVNNCRDYNGKDSEYTEAAMKLLRCFKRAYQKHVPREDRASDDEYVAGSRWDPLDPFSHRPKRAAHSRARQSLQVDAMDSSGDDSGTENNKQSSRKRQREVSESESLNNDPIGKKGPKKKTFIKKPPTPDSSGMVSEEPESKKKCESGLSKAPAPERLHTGPASITRVLNPMCSPRQQQQQDQSGMFQPRVGGPPSRFHSPYGGPSGQWSHSGGGEMSSQHQQHPMYHQQGYMPAHRPGGPPPLAGRMMGPQGSMMGPQNAGQGPQQGGMLGSGGGSMMGHRGGAMMGGRGAGGPQGGLRPPSHASGMPHGYRHPIPYSQDMPPPHIKGGDKGVSPRSSAPWEGPQGPLRMPPNSSSSTPEMARSENSTPDSGVVSSPGMHSPPNGPNSYNPGAMGQHQHQQRPGMMPPPYSDQYGYRGSMQQQSNRFPMYPHHDQHNYPQHTGAGPYPMMHRPLHTMKGPHSMVPSSQSMHNTFPLQPPDGSMPNQPLDTGKLPPYSESDCYSGGAMPPRPPTCGHPPSHSSPPPTQPINSPSNKLDEDDLDSGSATESYDYSDAEHKDCVTKNSDDEAGKAETSDAGQPMKKAVKSKARGKNTKGGKGKKGKNKEADETGGTGSTETTTAGEKPDKVEENGPTQGVQPTLGYTRSTIPNFPANKMSGYSGDAEAGPPSMGPYGPRGLPFRPQMGHHPNMAGPYGVQQGSMHPRMPGPGGQNLQEFGGPPGYPHHAMRGSDIHGRPMGPPSGFNMPQTRPPYRDRYPTPPRMPPTNYTVDQHPHMTEQWSGVNPMSSKDSMSPPSLEQTDITAPTSDDAHSQTSRSDAAEEAAVDSLSRAGSDKSEDNISDEEESGGKRRKKGGGKRGRKGGKTGDAEGKKTGKKAGKGGRKNGKAKTDDGGGEVDEAKEVGEDADEDKPSSDAPPLPVSGSSESLGLHQWGGPMPYGQPGMMPPPRSHFYPKPEERGMPPPAAISTSHPRHMYPGQPPQRYPHPTTTSKSTPTPPQHQPPSMMGPGAPTSNQGYSQYPPYPSSTQSFPNPPTYQQGNPGFPPEPGYSGAPGGQGGPPPLAGDLPSHSGPPGSNFPPAGFGHGPFPGQHRSQPSPALSHTSEARSDMSSRDPSVLGDWGSEKNSEVDDDDEVTSKSRKGGKKGRREPKKATARGRKGKKPAAEEIDSVQLGDMASPGPPTEGGVGLMPPQQNMSHGVPPNSIHQSSLPHQMSEGPDASSPWMQGPQGFPQTSDSQPQQLPPHDYYGGSQQPTQSYPAQGRHPYHHNMPQGPANHWSQASQGWPSPQAQQLQQPGGPPGRPMRPYHPSGPSGMISPHHQPPMQTNEPQPAWINEGPMVRRGDGPEEGSDNEDKNKGKKPKRKYTRKDPTKAKKPGKGRGRKKMEEVGDDGMGDMGIMAMGAQEHGPMQGEGHGLENPPHQGMEPGLNPQFSSQMMPPSANPPMSSAPGYSGCVEGYREPEGMPPPSSSSMMHSHRQSMHPDQRDYPMHPPIQPHHPSYPSNPPRGVPSRPPIPRWDSPQSGVSQMGPPPVPPYSHQSQRGPGYNSSPTHNPLYSNSPRVQTSQSFHPQSSMPSPSSCQNMNTPSISSYAGSSYATTTLSTSLSPVPNPQQSPADPSQTNQVVLHRDKRKLSCDEEQVIQAKLWRPDSKEVEQKQEGNQSAKPNDPPAAVAKCPTDNKFIHSEVRSKETESDPGFDAGPQNSSVDEPKSSQPCLPNQTEMGRDSESLMNKRGSGPNDTGGHSGVGEPNKSNVLSSADSQKSMDSRPSSVASSGLSGPSSSHTPGSHPSAGGEPYSVNFPDSPQVYLDMDQRCQKVEAFEASNAAAPQPQHTPLPPTDESSSSPPGSPKVLLDLDNQRGGGSGAGSADIANGHPPPTRTFMDLDKMAGQPKSSRGRVGPPGMYGPAQQQQQMSAGRGGVGGGQHPVMMMQGMMDRFGDMTGGMGMPPGSMSPGGSMTNVEHPGQQSNYPQHPYYNQAAAAAAAAHTGSHMQQHNPYMQQGGSGYSSSQYGNQSSGGTMGQPHPSAVGHYPYHSQQQQQQMYHQQQQGTQYPGHHGNIPPAPQHYYHGSHNVPDNYHGNMSKGTY